MVDSARQAGLPPLVQLDGSDLAHECLTAQLVRRTKGRSTFAATPRIPLSRLTERSRQWLRAMSPAQRVTELVDAIDAASARATGAEADAEERWCERCQRYRDVLGCGCPERTS